jgi:putative endonuclease
MFFVYIIVSQVRNLRFYVGMTRDVENRLKEHNNKRTFSTKGYVPWELFFMEEFTTRHKARAREKYYKSGIGKKRIKQKWESKSKTESTKNVRH